MDVVDKETRSKYMAAVRSKGNASTEGKMLVLLRQHKLKGWRRHLSLKGTPDYCWPTKKVALFIDGCFWHGCPRCYKTPKSNIKFWVEKVEGNKRRDRRVNRVLRTAGWKVLRVWECSIKQKRTVSRLVRALKTDDLIQ